MISHYDQWREQKLAQYPQTIKDITVSINDPIALSEAEKAHLLDCLKQTNMVIYHCPRLLEKEQLRRFVAHFNLYHLDHNECADNDAITSLQVNSSRSHITYIPYSNKPLSWHCDGYYNPPNKQIHSVVLHCVSSALEGGENQLLDPDLLYIHCYDINPRYIEVLAQPDVLTIPENIRHGKIIRGRQSGPVFSLSPSGRLYLRYSARKKNIIWKNDPLVHDAVRCIVDYCQYSPYIFKVTLKSGQGLLSRNVLHNRSGFKNGNQTRLIYRARFYDELY